MIGHPVLNTAGHIHVLGFGVNDALAAVESEMDCEQRGVADHSLQAFKARGISINCRLCSYHRPLTSIGQSFDSIENPFKLWAVAQWVCFDRCGLFIAEILAGFAEDYADTSPHEKSFLRKIDYWSDVILGRAFCF